jgi:hypothetical protein
LFQPVAQGSNEKSQIEVTVTAHLAPGFKPPICDALCMKQAIEKQLDEVIHNYIIILCIIYKLP